MPDRVDLADVSTLQELHSYHTSQFAADPGLYIPPTPTRRADPFYLIEKAGELIAIGYIWRDTGQLAIQSATRQAIAGASVRRHRPA